MTRSLLPILWSDCYLSSGHRFRFSNRPHKLLTATAWNHFLTIIGLLAGVAGMICLFCGSFSENQFRDAVKLKVVVFTILPLLVLVFLWKATKCIEVIEKVCHKHVHIKTVVKIVLLGCATMVNLLIKFPRFNVHYSKYKKCSIGEQGKHSQGSRFNLYSAGSFTAFALVISSKGEKAMELGIFDFLLGLTMDASMEILGNDGLNLLYTLGAFVYCASLIFIRSCLESFMLSRDISGAQQENIQDLTMVLVEGAREDAAEETVNFVTYDPATEDYGETIGLPHITMPKLMRSNTMPELMRSNTMPELMRSNSMPELMRLNSMPDLMHLKTMPQLKKKRRTFFSSNVSHLRDLLRLKKKKRRTFLSSNVFHLRDLFRKRRDGTSLLTEDRQKNRVRTDEIDGVEQRDEIDGAFLDVGSSKDAYLPDGLRKKRN